MTKRKAEWLILLITLFWGSSYLFMKMGLEELGPCNVIFLRFGVAFLATLPLLLRRRAKLNRTALLDGAVLGLLLAGLFLFLLNGLEHTTSANAGFLTSLTVVFVPVIMALKTRTMPAQNVLLGLLLSLCGIGLLTLSGGMQTGGASGDALCVIGAFFYALQICYTNYAARRSDPVVIGVVQLGVASLCGLVLALFLETPTLPTTSSGIFAVLMLGLLCSGFGFVMQPVAQRFTTPTRTGLIFSLEPVFAALLGMIFLNEAFTVNTAVGAVLAFAGVMVSSMGSQPEPRLRSAAGTAK